MQTIARANRVFPEKQNGLIVDYIGILQNLKKALKDYSPNDQDKTGIPEEDAVAAMLEAFERVCGIFHGFDYSKGIQGTPTERLATLASALDWVLQWQESEAAKVKDIEAKKAVHRAYQDAVLTLTKAYALAAASSVFAPNCYHRQRKPHCM